jgi:hypothetical protein
MQNNREVKKACIFVSPLKTEQKNCLRESLSGALKYVFPWSRLVGDFVMVNETKAG